MTKPKQRNGDGDGNFQMFTKKEDNFLLEYWHDLRNRDVMVIKLRKSAIVCDARYRILKERERQKQLMTC